MTTVVKPTTPTKSNASRGNRYPFWSPRVWHGMRAGDWYRLLSQNRFRVSPSPIRCGLACTVSMFTVFNSCMHQLEQLIYGNRIRSVEIQHPPLFIVGHWRSGTTMLHELLVCDDEFTYPSTYECFAPNHFLLTERLLGWLVHLLLPSQRPMDNMAMGADLPQEDEFALVNLGSHSPYLHLAFPNHPPVDMEYLDMSDLSPEDVRAWRETLDLFVRKLTLRCSKRVVLKSPTHTGRISELLNLYPGAQFIHIARHPYSLFPSTMRLWKTLDDAQGFQTPNGEYREKYVLDCLDRMYRGYESQRSLLGPDQLVEVRYEDLVRDPMAQLQDVYARLRLGDFDRIRPKIADYQNRKKDYQPNQHELAPEIKDEIRRRWKGYFERYGYSGD